MLAFLYSRCFSSIVTEFEYFFFVCVREYLCKRSFNVHKLIRYVWVSYQVFFFVYSLFSSLSFKELVIGPFEITSAHFVCDLLFQQDFTSFLIFTVKNSCLAITISRSCVPFTCKTHMLTFLTRCFICEYDVVITETILLCTWNMKCVYAGCWAMV